MTNKLILLVFAIIVASGCTTMHGRLSQSGKKKVFIVKKQPTRCKYMGAVQGVGTESFEGNSKYTVPLAYADIKHKAARAGANVVFIENQQQQGYSYLVQGSCYKCRTKIVRRRRSKRFKVAKRK